MLLPSHTHGMEQRARSVLPPWLSRSTSEMALFSFDTVGGSKLGDETRPVQVPTSCRRSSGRQCSKPHSVGASLAAVAHPTTPVNPALRGSWDSRCFQLPELKSPRRARTSWSPCERGPHSLAGSRWEGQKKWIWVWVWSHPGPELHLISSVYHPPPKAPPPPTAYPRSKL